jgi:hypothetical protein
MMSLRLRMEDCILFLLAVEEIGWNDHVAKLLGALPSAGLLGCVGVFRPVWFGCR